MSILVHMSVSVDIVYFSPYLCICPYLLICLYLQILFISVNMHRIQSHPDSPCPISESPCTISNLRVTVHHLHAPSPISESCSYLCICDLYPLESVYIRSISVHICWYLQMYVHICLYVCIYSYVYICASCLYLAVRAAKGSKWWQTTARSLRVTVRRELRPNRFPGHVHICAYAVNIHSYWFVSDQYQWIYAHIYLYMCISVYISKLQFEGKPPNFWKKGFFILNPFSKQAGLSAPQK